jgi:Holliday junction resolvase-like predicted endonuclease
MRAVNDVSTMACCITSKTEQITLDAWQQKHDAVVMVMLRKQEKHRPRANRNRLFVEATKQHKIFTSAVYYQQVAEQKKNRQLFDSKRRFS